MIDEVARLGLMLFSAMWFFVAIRYMRKCRELERSNERLQYHADRYADHVDRMNLEKAVNCERLKKIREALDEK